MHILRSTNFNRLLFAVLSISLSAGCVTKPRFTPTSISLPPEQQPIPINMINGLPIFITKNSSGEITGQLLDTGTSVSIISEHLIRNENVPTRKISGTLQDAMGTETRINEIIRIPALRLKNHTIIDFDALVMDLQKNSIVCDYTINFIFGFSLFKDYLLTIDYPSRQMMISSDFLYEDADTLPIRINEWGTPEVQVKIQNHVWWFLIDTGSSSGFHLPQNLSSELNFQNPPVPTTIMSSISSRERSHIARLNSNIQIGRHAFVKPMITLSSNCEQPSIGFEVLRHFKLDIDQRKKLVRLKRRIEKPIETQSLRTLGFLVSDSSGHALVKDIVPGSGAATSDLRIDDQLIKIANVPIEKFTATQKKELLSKSGSFEVIVMRQGEKMTIAIPITTLVQ